ncbi:hypothetical protein P170DRAFT_471993 [Aspergillus steynii IBT 23096]|uniref:Uncharacterized protein n=1 Tax=Aspergillus steynii IBT 23096 TaxID=1392250 RepID=A0A2I2GGT4_9EURO|nr:uncharacterized protein P170DRAFT_471993 [Aspergillus steynii IBT 23096]PLB52083.1 hypothetical protein P170DRAFT_471993 [Aspergillus steynii IBT 23096]
MATPAPKDQLPVDAEEWNHEAEQAGTTLRSLRSCRELMSGSKVTKEQYLLFRVICKRPSRSFESGRFGLTALMQQADPVTSSPGLQKYLESPIGTNKSSSIEATRQSIERAGGQYRPNHVPAELVAWIKERPDPSGSPPAWRPLVSQDGVEL